MNSEEQRSIEESYVSATTTSNLRVEADRRGDADVIIAAGWSQSRVGSALLRLHSEWDSAEKPRRLPADAVARMADLRKADYLKTENPDEVARALVPIRALRDAQVEAEAWFGAEVHRLVLQLKSLSAIVEQMRIQMDKWKIEGGRTAAMEIIGWWLHQACPVCGGTKFQVVLGTSRHNGKLCAGCEGSGKSEIPRKQDGRKMVNWLDDCVMRAREQIRDRLRHYRN